MQLEDTIMRNLIRIGANARRKLHNGQKPEGRPCRGFGHILDLLSQNDGLSLQQIAQTLNIRPQSVSEAVSNMENHGLIRKQTNENDRRSALIFITQEGRERQAEMLSERIENAKRIFASLDENEKMTLLGLLEKVTAALQENKEEL